MPKKGRTSERRRERRLRYELDVQEFLLPDLWQIVEAYVATDPRPSICTTCEAAFHCRNDLFRHLKSAHHYSHIYKTVRG